jgi:tRNA A-37 threonylcarbamoyl transferase component Bud32
MEYIEGESLDNAMKRIVTSDSKVDVRKNLKIIERVGRKLAKTHCLGVALGDTKPENFLIGKHGEIYFMDFEQAARNGDKVWDLAEFLYYTGHEVPPLAEARKAERIAKTFIKGYLEGGGKAETVRKAGTTKYTKVFSVFTLPHIMLSFSSICRNVDKLRIEHGQT